MHTRFATSLNGELEIVPAQPTDLTRYLNVLDEVAEWLRSTGLPHWAEGSHRNFTDYFAKSIECGEVYLAMLRLDLVGTMRLLERDSIVWPEIKTDDGLYVYNLAIRRAWSGRGFGRQLLEFASVTGQSLGRQYVRLDCLSESVFLKAYYENEGFTECGEIYVRYPPPVGGLRLIRFERPIAGPTRSNAP